MYVCVWVHCIPNFENRFSRRNGLRAPSPFHLSKKVPSKWTKCASEPRVAVEGDRQALEGELETAYICLGASEGLVGLLSPDRRR